MHHLNGSFFVDMSFYFNFFKVLFLTLPGWPSKQILFYFSVFLNQRFFTFQNFKTIFTMMKAGDSTKTEFLEFSKISNRF